MANEHDSWLKRLGITWFDTNPTEYPPPIDPTQPPPGSPAPDIPPGQPNPNPGGDPLNPRIPRPPRLPTELGEALEESIEVGEAAEAAGFGVAGGVIAAGFAVGVLAPIAIGYSMQRSEELQQQTDPDEKSLPGGAPPPSNSYGDDGADGGAPPPGD